MLNIHILVQITFHNRSIVVQIFDKTTVCFIVYPSHQTGTTGKTYLEIQDDKSWSMSVAIEFSVGPNYIADLMIIVTDNAYICD